jgi:hypothetical protein
MLEEDIAKIRNNLLDGQNKTLDLIRTLYPEIKRNQISKTIQSDLLPALLKMEKDNEISLSSQLNSTKEYPIYVTRNRKSDPLWMREIEEIVKDFSFAKTKEQIKKLNRNDSIKDKVIRFNKLFEQKSGDIVPPGDWQKVFMIFMENNIDNENVWVACVEAFKAGVLWNTYKDQLDNGHTKTKE